MTDELPPVDRPKRLVITEDSLIGEPTGAGSPQAGPPSDQSAAPAGPTLLTPSAPAQVPLPVVAPPKAPVAGGSFCSACGSPVDPRAMVCPRCGVAGPGALAATAAMAAVGVQQKSPGMAILLSLLFTGAGQFYCGRPGRGVLFFVAAVLSGVLILAVVGFILLPIVWIWAAIDANKLANEHNKRLLQGVGLAS